MTAIPSRSRGPGVFAPTVLLVVSMLAGCGRENVDRQLAGAVAPVTPGVATDVGVSEGDVRTFEVIASEFRQRIANFPIQEVTVWGYNGSTPGPTLVARHGETVRVVLENRLPVPTTMHFHGMHAPNEDDGVAGISQVEPVPPGGSHVYEFTPGHPGTFAYHAHTDGAVQILRGLDGIFIVLPDGDGEHVVDHDLAFTLQQFAAMEEGQLVDPAPPGNHFGFSTMNGVTGEAAGEPVTISEGDRIRIRLYNASNANHPMHLHGHDFVIVSRNGHEVPREARHSQQTVDVAPGTFFEIEWTADRPGNWVFHCHIPHHTANHHQAGWRGAPVGMSRIFHYEGFAAVPEEYFRYRGEAGHHGG